MVPRDHQTLIELGSRLGLGETRSLARKAQQSLLVSTETSTRLALELDDDDDDGMICDQEVFLLGGSLPCYGGRLSRRRA